MRPRFQPLDLVKIKTPNRQEQPGSQPPRTLIMGKTGCVEIASLINSAVSATGESMPPAYYIRIDNLPPVLIHEEWLEEG